MAELAQLTITVDSAAATRNIQKLVKSLQTATKPIQQVQKQLSTLDKTVKVMQGGFKGFGNILKGLIKLIGGGLFKVLSGVGKIAGGLVTGAFKMLGSILGSVVGLFKGLFKVVKFFGSGLIGATKEVVKFGLGLKALILSVVLTQVQKLVDAFQQITNRLRLAVEAQKDFNKVFARAYTISKQTRTGLYEVADLYTRIAMVTRKLGVSQAQLARVTQLVSKSVAISGASATTARGALIQLGQAFSIGVLRGDEFRSVQEALPGLLDQVARRLNVTRGELREMAYQGKVTSEVLLKTILESGKALDEQFKNIKPTLEQAFTVVNNAVVVFTGRVTKALQANDKLFRTITKIADFLDNVTDSTIQGIAIAIEDIFGRLGEFFKAVLKDMSDVSEKMKKVIVSIFPNRGLEALSAFDLFVVGLHRSLLSVINFLDMIRKDIPVVLKLAGAISSAISSQIKNLLIITREYMSRVADNIQGLIGATGLTFASFFKYVKEEINQVLKDLNSMIHKVVSAPKFIQLGIAGMAKGLAGIFSDEEAAKLQKKMDGIMEEIKTVPDYLGAVGNTATDHFKDLSNTITTLGKSLGKLFTVEFEEGSPAAKAVQSIKDEFKEILALQKSSQEQFAQSGRERAQAQSKLDPQTVKLIETLSKKGSPAATEDVGEAGAFTGKTFWEQFVGSFDAAFEKKGGAELVANKFAGSFVGTLGEVLATKGTGLFGLGGFSKEKAAQQQQRLAGMMIYGDQDKLSPGQEIAAKDGGVADIVASIIEGFGTGDIVKMLVEIVMKLDVVKKVLELSMAAILEPLNAITSFLMPILDELGGMIKAVSEGIMGLVKPLISMLRPFQGIIRLLGGFFKNILKSFSIVLRPIARLLEALLPVLDMLNPILQTIGQVLAAFMSLLGSVVDYFVTRLIGGGQETHDLLMMEQEIIEELTNNTKDLGESLEVIDDAVRSITESALNIAAPAQKLEDAKSRYLELFKAATGEGAEKEDITEFTNFAKTYLKQAQDVLRSSGAYVEIYDAVLGDLEKVGEATFAGSSAVSDFNKANVELQAIGSTIRFDLKNSFTDLIDEVGNHADRIARRLRDYELAEYGGLSPGQIADMDLGGQAPGTYTSGIVALPNSTVNQIVTSGSTGRGTSRSFMSAPLSSSTTPEYTFESAPDSGTSGSGGQTTGLENIGEMAGALLQALIDGIVNAITGLLDIVKAFTMFLVEVIVAFITGYLNILKAFAELVGQLISNAVDAVKALAEFYKKLFQGIVNALSALAEFFKKILGAAVEAIQALVKLYETLFKGIVSAVTAFGSIISLLIRGVLSAGDALGSFFSSIFTGAGMAITSVVTSLFNVIFGTSSGGNIVQYLFDMIFSKMITFSSPIGAIPIIPGQLFGQGNKHILQVEFFKDMASGGNVSDVVTGGVAKGPSHQSGMIGTTKDGSPFLFEGGEFIINKKSADALGPDFLYAMNSYGTGGILPEGFAFNKKSNKDSDAHTFFSLPPIFHGTGNDFEIGPKVITEIPKSPWREKFRVPGTGIQIGPLFSRDKLGAEATVGSNFGGVAKGEIFSAKYGSVPRFFKANAGIYTGGLGGLPDIKTQLKKGDYVFADNPFVTASGNNIQKVGGVPLQYDKGLGRLPFSDTELYGHYNLNFPFDIHKSSAGFGRRRAERTPMGGGLGYLFKMLMYLLGGPQDENGDYTGGLFGNISKFLYGKYGTDEDPKQGFGFINMFLDTLQYMFGRPDLHKARGTGMYDSDGEEIKDKKGYFLKLQDYFDRGIGLDAQRFVRFFTDNSEDNFNIIDYFYDLTDNLFGLGGEGSLMSRNKVKNFLSVIGLNKGNTDALLEMLLSITRMKLGFGDFVPTGLPNLGDLFKNVLRRPKSGPQHIFSIFDLLSDGSIADFLGTQSFTIPGGTRPLGDKPKSGPTPIHNLGEMLSIANLLGSFRGSTNMPRHRGMGSGGKIPQFDGGGSLLILSALLGGYQGLNIAKKNNANIDTQFLGALTGMVGGVLAPNVMAVLGALNFLHGVGKSFTVPKDGYTSRHRGNDEMGAVAGILQGLLAGFGSGGKIPQFGGGGSLAILGAILGGLYGYRASSRAKAPDFEKGLATLLGGAAGSGALGSIGLKALASISFGEALAYQEDGSGAQRAGSGLDAFILNAFSGFALPTRKFGGRGHRGFDLRHLNPFNKGPRGINSRLMEARAALGFGAGGRIKKYAGGGALHNLMGGLGDTLDLIMQAIGLPFKQAGMYGDYAFNAAFENQYGPNKSKTRRNLFQALLQGTLFEDLFSTDMNIVDPSTGEHSPRGYIPAFFTMLAQMLGIMPKIGGDGGVKGYNPSTGELARTHRGMGMGGGVKKYSLGGFLTKSIGSNLGNIAGVIGNLVFGARSLNNKDTSLYGGLFGKRGLGDNILKTLTLPFTKYSGGGVEGLLQFFLSDLLHGRDQGRGFTEGGLLGVLSSFINLASMIFGLEGGELTKQELQRQKKLGPDPRAHRGMGMGGGVKKYASGGMVYGPSHAQGGVLAELEGGEYVLPKYQVGAMVTGQSGYQARTQSSGAGSSGISDLLGLGSAGAEISILVGAVTDLIEAISGDSGLVPALVEGDVQFMNLMVNGFENAEGEMVDGFIPQLLAVQDGLNKMLFGEDGNGGIMAMVTMMQEQQATTLAGIEELTKFNVEVAKVMTGLVALVVLIAGLSTGIGQVIAVIGAFAAFYKANQEAIEGVPKKIGAFFNNVMAILRGEAELGGLGFKFLRNPFGGGDDTRLIEAGIGNPDHWQDIPIFAGGGHMRGPSHAAGGIPIEVEGGEYIINKKSVSKIGLPFLNALNSYEDGGPAMPSKGTLTPINFGSAGANVRDLGEAGRKFAEWFGETYMNLNMKLPGASGGAKFLGSTIFAKGGFAEPTGTAVNGAFNLSSGRRGNDVFGYVEGGIRGALLPPSITPYASYEAPPWTGGLGDIFSFESGGSVPRMSYRSGGAVSSNDSELAMAINQLAGAIRSQGTTEVNVYTDLEGQTRAAVSEYRAEVRERQARSL